MAQKRSPLGTRGLRRHLRWILPLLLGFVGFVVFAVVAGMLANSLNDGAPNPGAALGALALYALALLSVILGVVFFVIGGVQVLSQWRRRRRHAAGKYTQAEIAQRAQQDHFAASWEGARQLRSQLVQRTVPSQIQVWEVVPRAGESFFYDTTATYARFYGQNVTYSQSGGFFFGHPLFVAAGLAMSAAGNASRRSAAEAAAAAQWREQQTVRLLVSNQRLVCNANGQWLSFDFTTMSAVFPEVDRWTLVCQFERAEPLLLSGPSVPAAALVTVLMTHGPDAVQQHPSLQQLQ